MIHEPINQEPEEIDEHSPENLKEKIFRTRLIEPYNPYQDMDILLNADEGF